MTNSILNTIKKTLGVPVDDTAFDVDILLHINGAIATLSQLGVGPADPILVVDKDTEWSSLTEVLPIQGMAIQFIYLSVRLLFDPPQTSFVTEALSRRLLELTWRLEVEANPYIVLPPVEIEES